MRAASPAQPGRRASDDRHGVPCVERQQSPEHQQHRWGGRSIRRSRAGYGIVQGDHREAMPLHVE